MRVILILITGVALAAEPVLPPAAQVVVDQLQREIQAAQLKAAKALRPIQEAEIKKGNLDEALAIRALITRLDPGKDLAPFVGAWANGDEVFRLAGDGTYTGSCHNPRWENGRWLVSGDQKTITLILDHDGSRHGFTVTSPTQWEEQGSGKVWTRR